MEEQVLRASAPPTPHTQATHMHGCVRASARALTVPPAHGTRVRSSLRGRGRVAKPLTSWPLPPLPFFRRAAVFALPWSTRDRVVFAGLNAMSAGLFRRGHAGERHDCDSLAILGWPWTDLCKHAMAPPPTPHPVRPARLSAAVLPPPAATPDGASSSSARCSTARARATAAAPAAAAATSATPAPSPAAPAQATRGAAPAAAGALGCGPVWSEAASAAHRSSIACTPGALLE